ncbi:MAG: redoxin family protein [Gemmatimonadales bacterium]
MTRLALLLTLTLGLPATDLVAQSGRAAPAWSNATWLNAASPLRLDQLKGHVVLVNFWVYSCYNCTNTIPALLELERRHAASGLVTLGMHTPEFPPYSGEHDAANVERALKRYGITYPVAQDNDRRTWDRYGIRYWPTVVLIDKRGRIRHEEIGEFHPDDARFAEVDRRIRALLAE